MKQLLCNIKNKETLTTTCIRKSIKRFKIYVLTLCILFAILPNIATNAAATDYTISGSTITIYNAAGLAWYRDELNNNGSYRTYTVNLANDIDLSNYTWRSIGRGEGVGDDTQYTFQGTFDGCGHTINGLTGMGLFGVAISANIKNVILINVNVTYATSTTLWSLDYSPPAGGVVNAAANSTINNCHVFGSITNNANELYGNTPLKQYVYAGAILGISSGGSYKPNTIINCSANASVTSYSQGSRDDKNRWVSNTYAGGLVGAGSTSTGSTTSIYNSYFTGTVYANSTQKQLGDGSTAYAGGIANNNCVINNCYAVANVSTSAVSHTYVGEIASSAQSANYCYWVNMTTGIINCSSVSNCSQITAADLQSATRLSQLNSVADTISGSMDWVDVSGVNNDYPVMGVTISFVSNGGSAVGNLSNAYGSGISAPTAPTKTGYTFAGWYYDSALTNAVSWPVLIGANTTFYAAWTINQYSVSFDSNGGSTVPSITQNYNTIVTKPADPVRDGYTFSGWNHNSDLSSPVIWPITLGAENKTLYAVWTANNYNISFDSQGGTSAVNQSVTYGLPYGTLPAVTRNGYSFEGWYTETGGNGTKIIYTTTVTTASNHTLYANWTVNPTEINFLNESYTAKIPDTGENTISVVAQVKDSYGNVISNAPIVYSLVNPYTGVSINSSTGVVTVTNQAQVGTAQISATYGTLSDTATLNFEDLGLGGSLSGELTFSTTTNQTYYISLTASNIGSFAGRTFTLAYDSAVLQISDLCAFTHGKELEIGSIERLGLTITSVSPGQIIFEVNKNISQGKKWSGTINIFAFTALNSQSTTVSVT